MEDMLMYAVKLTVGLIGVMIVLRLMGKKEMAQITPLDFVYALILGGIIEEGLYDATIAVYEMVFSLFFWALLIYVFERFAIKSRRFKNIAQGEPETIIKDGKLNPKVLDKNNMDVDEVRMLLRMKDIFSLSEVKYAVLEESGDISALKYSKEEPPTRSEMMEDYSENSMSYLLIDTGKIEYKRLESLGFNEEWLQEKIKEQTSEELEDIYFAEWDEDNGFFIQTRE